MKRIHKNLQPFRNIIRLILIFICFFSKPPWCSALGNQIDNECREAYDGTQYYRSPVFLLPENAVGTMASFVMIIITLDIYFAFFIYKGYPEFARQNLKRLWLANAML
jgi:hypothetical protein